MLDLEVMLPIELLQQELDKYNKALSKSNRSFYIGEITKEAHEIHLQNLTPIISNYKFAIILLKQYTQ